VSVVDVATGLPATGWTAGHTYKATVSCSAPTYFDGYLFAPLLGSPASFASGSARAGAFATVAGDAGSQACAGCSGAITHVSNPAHTTVSAMWTPPAAGAGAVTLWAILTVTKSGGVNYNVKLALPEIAAGTPSGSATPGAPTATRAPTTSASASRQPAGASPSSSGASGVSGALPSRAAAADTSAASSSFGVADIVGGVAGGVAIGVAVAALAVFVVLRRRASPKRKMMMTAAQKKPAPQHLAGQVALPATPADAALSGSQHGGGGARTIFAPLPPPALSAARADASTIGVTNPYARSFASE
jgi:hypothetical protein